MAHVPLLRRPRFLHCLRSLYDDIRLIKGSAFQLRGQPPPTRTAGGGCLRSHLTAMVDTALADLTPFCAQA
eukprot:6710064-Pyramimonas_sp.AAC.1